jgi:hypothetical protein
MFLYLAKGNEMLQLFYFLLLAIDLGLKLFSVLLLFNLVQGHF